MNNLYKTQDIILAATLKVKGYKLITVDVHGNKGTFSFEDVPEQTVIDYDIGNLLVEPASFNNTVKQLTTTCRRMSDSRGYKDLK